MHLLDGLLGTLLLLVSIVLNIKASQNHPCIIKTGGATFADFDFAGFLFVFPDTGGAVFAAADEGAVGGAQVDAGDAVCVADEGA